MKKYFVYLFLTIFVSALFAQETIERVPQDIQNQVLAKKYQQNLQAEKVAKVRLAEKGLFAISKPATGIEADVAYWSYDFENTDSVMSADLTIQPVYGDTSYLNPQEGTSAWWVGTINEFWDVPVGYGDNWRQALNKNDDVTLESGLSTASYDYYLLYDNEGDDFDYLLLQVSTDNGTSWETLEDYQGTNGAYTMYSTDLSSYIGSTFKLRWYFFSDGAFSSADGNDFSNGAFWLDASAIVKDGTSTMFDDGGDTMVGFTAATAVTPFGDFWTWTTNDASSGTHSFQTDKYVANSLFMLYTGPIDLTGVAAGYKLTLDFQVKATGLHKTGTLAEEDYWYVQISNNAGATWNDLDGYVWQDMDEWTSWVTYLEQYTSDSDISAYAGETIYVRWVFRANPTTDQTDGTAGLYIDDPRVLIGVDPNEPNDGTSTATQLELPYANDEVLIAPLADADYYMFYAEAGQFLNVMVDNANVDTEVLLASAGSDAPGAPGFYYIPDDPNNPDFPGLYTADGLAYDQIFAELHYTGWYMMRVRATTDPDAEGPFTGPYKLIVKTVAPVGEMLEVEDVPNDQGLQVRLKFQASEFEFDGVPTEYMPEFYSIERRTKTIGNDFEFVKTVPVKYGTQEEYYTLAPTPQDGKNWGFRVVTHIPDMMRVFNGDPMNGQSEDNLTPEFLNNTVTPNEDNVEVAWNIDLSVHFDMTHIEIYRSTTAGFTPGATNRIATLSENTTEYADNGLVDGTYYYVVGAFDDGGNVSYSEEMIAAITDVEDVTGVPTEFGINQNYPNPFNPATTIKYALPSESNVSIAIYNTLGQQVTQLVNTVQNAGYKTVNFNAANLSSGIYFYVIKANAIDGSGEFNATKKMILMK